MKLYVWNNPYSVSYGSSCLYVVASSLPQARKLARRAAISRFGFPPDKSPDHDYIDVSAKEPDRVMPLPHAEVYEWSE